MRFGEKLKQLRTEKKMTQPELAAKLGVTTRTLQNYEWGKMYPKQSEVYGKIAAIFNVTADWLLNDEDRYLIDAQERGGAKTKRDINALITEVGGLFAGGELSEDDMDAVMKSLTEAYWDAKEKNKKYTPKKYKK